MAPGDDYEEETFHPFDEMYFGPSQLTDSYTADYCVGGEVSIRVTVAAQYHMDLTVDATIAAIMWEWRNCDNRDRAGNVDDFRTVGPLETEVVDIRLDNPENFGGDFADIHLELFNDIQR